MKNWDDVARAAIADLDEQRITGKALSPDVVNGVIETMDFLRLHAGALEVHINNLRDWLGCGEGMMVVPIRVTGNMLKAGIDAQRVGKLIPELWSDMLDAAPGNHHAPM